MGKHTKAEALSGGDILKVVVHPDGTYHWTWAVPLAGPPAAARALRQIAEHIELEYKHTQAQ